MTTIRRATIDDLERLEPLARKFYASSTRLRIFDPARFVGLWTTLLKGSAAIFLLLEEGQVTGAIGGVAHPEPYSTESTATEFFWFVEPGRRGGGIKLYRSFEGWARSLGCSEIRMGRLADVMPEKVERAYKALGFREVETVYAKRLEVA